MTTTVDIPLLPEPTPCEIPSADTPSVPSVPKVPSVPSSPSPSPISNLQSQIPSPPRLLLARARAIGEHVADALRPFCHQIAIAGSIRRQRPTCGDIDLVVLPADLPGLLARVRQSCTIKSSGDLNTIAVMSNGVQLDIFCARPAGQDLFSPTPGTWGTLLLCRTGSKQFNIWLADQAKARGLHWNPYRGLCRGGHTVSGAGSAGAASARVS
jgi:DNA polymerase/3'-5' exonuclease PolX